jgi:thiosulfate reductase cytochrome b subunit
MQDDDTALQNTDPSGVTLGFDPDGLAQLLLIGTVVSIVLTVLLVVYIILNTAHRWRSEKAMVQMQKDIGAIRDMVEHASVSPSKVPAAPTEAPLPESTVAAPEESTERSQDA